MVSGLTKLDVVGIWGISVSQIKEGRKKQMLLHFRKNYKSQLYIVCIISFSASIRDH